MNKVWIALGTNIEPRETYLRQAIEELNQNNAIKLMNRSSIYQTVPVGYLDQADFLNMVIEIETTMPAIDLLDTCQSIEQGLGRERGIRFGPRTIDLDILLYNEESIQVERLVVPHPRMHERAFVLVPLSEIASDRLIPGLDRTVKAQLAHLPSADLGDVRKWSQGSN